MGRIKAAVAALFVVAFHTCALAGNVLTIGIGSSPNDTTGDPLRTAFGKINTAVNGLASCFSGTIAPSSLMTFQCWFDTSTTPATYRFFDGTQWVAAGTLDQTAHVFAPQGGMTVGGDLTGTLPNPTLKAVNSNVGNFGSPSAIPIFTVNNKGQVTAVTTATATAAAATLTGTTLAAGVVNSSLTSVGIIVSGTWRGAPVQPQWGGTGLATLAAHGVVIGEGTSNAVVSGAGTAGQVLTSNGASADPTFQSTFGNGVPPPQGRLTLATATPVMTVTTAGQPNIYYTPYQGNFIPLPVSLGGAFVAVPFVEMSQLTTDTTASPAAVAPNSCYDLFVWNNSGTIMLSRGPAWTTCVGAGVRAATGGIARPASPNNGFPVNSSSITNGPTAGMGLWVGTIASNSSSLIDWIYGATAAGGTAGSFGIWNTYNPIMVYSTTQDSTAGYSYATATYRQADASAGNQCSFVSGSMTREIFKAQYLTAAQFGTATAFVGIGFNSTTTPSGIPSQGANTSGSDVSIAMMNSMFMTAFIGFDTFTALEKGTAASTFNIGGDGGLICSGPM